MTEIGKDLLRQLFSRISIVVIFVWVKLCHSLNQSQQTPGDKSAEWVSGTGSQRVALSCELLLFVTKSSHMDLVLLSSNF